MAFYGTGFGAPAFGGYAQSFAAPTFIGGAHPVAVEAASQAEDAASQQGVSVSGFAGQPFYGQFAAPTAFAPTTYGAPIETVLPATQFVPVAAPQIRRPGYNERLIAWRNRQKAFNRYKRATKEAIKNANRAQAWAHLNQQYAVAPTTFAAPAYTQFAAAPAYGATYLPYGSQYPVVYDQGFAQAAPVAEAQEATYGEFNSYSQGQAEHQQEAEPEIRGTQV